MTISKKETGKDLASLEGREYKVSDEVYFDLKSIMDGLYRSGKQVGNFGDSLFLKVGHTNSVKPVVFVDKPVGFIPEKNKVFQYSDRSLIRLRAAEKAVRAKAIIDGNHSYLITLTFPVYVTNECRWRVNDRFRKSIRMVDGFDSGLWVAEAHTGNDYLNRDGVLVKGNKAMRGMIHFHYRVNSPMKWDLVLDWLKGQIRIDRKELLNEGFNMNDHAYDVKGNDWEWLYLCIHESKVEQKELVVHTGRVWAKWGIDTKPEVIRVEDAVKYGVFSAIKKKQIYSDDSIHVALQQIKKERKIKNEEEFWKKSAELKSNL